MLIRTAGAMEAWGQQLYIPPGTLVTLEGPLGSGKTTLARGLLRGLGYEGGVTSPTFALMELYTLSDGVVAHCDLYRLHHPEEVMMLDLPGLLRAGARVIVEWPQRGGAHLPEPSLCITLAVTPQGHTVMVESSA